MSEKVTAAKFESIQRSDIESAIDRLRDGGMPPKFGESVLFDVLHVGRRYPTKAVAALAVERILGRLPSPSDFSGGEVAASTRVLLDKGFEVVTKAQKVGSLDATFFLGRSASEDFFVFESRGPNRNIDYMAGLGRALACLGELEVSVLDAFVDSKATRALGVERVSLPLDEIRYPIKIDSRRDGLSVAHALGRSAAAVGRVPGATGAGNSTKRLRLRIDLPDGLSLASLAECIAGSAPAAPHAPQEFAFVPSVPGAWQSESRRRALEPVIVRFDHKQMQLDLFAKLVAEHGPSCVAAEHVMACGTMADLVVKSADGLIIFEVKTSLEPRACVREAVGQLLEYGFWPGSTLVVRMVVVGPSAIDVETQAFLEVLTRRFALPLEYWHQPLPDA